MWLQIGLAVLSALVLYFFREKQEGPRPATLDDFNVPKTTEGEEIGKIYGTVWITDPQVVWYGDFTAEDVKSSGGKK